MAHGSPRPRLLERRCARVGALCLMLIGSTVAAHHSYAMFDQSKTLTVKGSVHAVEWSNPHVWVWVDVVNTTGGTTTFGFETNSPSELARFFGWSKSALRVGEVVSVAYAPLKSGREGGALRTITRADGSTLRTPRSDPTYETGPRPSVPPASDTLVK